MEHRLKLLFAGFIIAIAVPAILSTETSTPEKYRGDTLNSTTFTLSRTIEKNVFYKHRHYLYWGPEGGRETITCGYGELNETLMREIKGLSRPKWEPQFIRVGNIIVKRFSTEYLSGDKLIRTTVTINAVLRKGKLLAFSKVAQTSPGPGAYTKVCTTLENGTQSCRMELSAYDIDSMRIDEFTFYYDFEEYVAECARSNQTLVSILKGLYYSENKD